MVQHCSVWNFAQDFSEYMCRYYLINTTSQLELRKKISTDHSYTMFLDVARFLIYLCRCFRKVFREVYALLGPIETINEERFMRFCIPRCEVFCLPQNHLSLLIACAFISELNYVFIEANRPRLPHASWKTFLAVFRRKYLIRFDVDGCWKELRGFCRGKLDEVIQSTYKPFVEMDVNHFTKYTLSGTEELGRSYVLIPVELCKNMPLYPKLNEFERILLACNVKGFQKRRLPRRHRCELCHGWCIDYMYYQELINDQRRGCIDR